MEGDENGREEDQGEQENGQEIPLVKGAGAVPGPPLLFPETAKLHGVRDRLDPVDAGKDEGRQDGKGVFQPPVELLLFGHIQSPRLLGPGDVAKFPLDVRNIPEREGNGIGDPVADPDPVQRGGEFARVGRYHEKEGGGDHGEIFQGNIELVKQLFRGHVVPSAQFQQHMARTVDLYPFLRGK